MNAFQDFKGYQSAPFFSWRLWNPVNASYSGDTTGLNSVLSMVFECATGWCRSSQCLYGTSKLMNE